MTSSGAAGVAAGSVTVWFAAALIAVLVMAVGCNGGESAAPVPTPTATATVLSATAVPSPTPVPPTETPVPPTETPVPPTATPEPPPTATASDLYGDLLIEGIYDWPDRMPEDLTPEVLQAVNVLTSALNLSIGLDAGTHTEEQRPKITSFLAPAIDASIGRDDGILLSYTSEDGPRRNRIAWTEVVTNSSTRLRLEGCVQISRTSLDESTGESELQDAASLQRFSFAKAGEGLVLEVLEFVDLDRGGLCAS